MSEKNTITVERLSDGRVVQVMPDGSKRLLPDETDWVRLRAMTEPNPEGFRRTGRARRYLEEDR